MADAALAAFHLWWIDAFGEHNHIGGATATRWYLDPLELGPNDVILDVGCFIGSSLRLAARRYRCQGIGLDPDGRFLELARAKAAREGLASQLRFSEGIAHETNLPESSVHVVLALEAPYDPGEAWRILKAGGSFCVAAPVSVSLEDFAGQLDAQGFRTERSLDATEEAIRSYSEVKERFLEEERPKEYLQAVEAELKKYEKSGLRYLRWVGRRR